MKLYLHHCLRLAMILGLFLAGAVPAHATPFSVSFVRSFEIDFGAATDAEGITVATVGGETSLWITDEGSSRQGGDGLVYNLDPVTGAVLSRPGGGSAIFTHPFGTNAEGIVYDPITQNLLITDTTGNAGTGVTAFQPNGPATGAMLDFANPFLFMPTWEPAEEPEGIAIHPVTGNVWIADEHDKRIYEFDRNGDVLSSFSVSGLGGISGAAGQGPEGLTFFSADYLIISDNTPGAPAVFLVPTTGDLGDAQTIEFCLDPLDPFCVLTDPKGLAFDPATNLLYILNATAPASCNPNIENCFPTVVVADVTAPMPEPGSPILFAAGSLLVSMTLRRSRRLASRALGAPGEGSDRG